MDNNYLKDLDKAHNSYFEIRDSVKRRVQAKDGVTAKLQHLATEMFRGVQKLRSMQTVLPLSKSELSVLFRNIVPYVKSLNMYAQAIMDTKEIDISESEAIIVAMQILSQLKSTMDDIDYNLNRSKNGLPSDFSRYAAIIDRSVTNLLKDVEKYQDPNQYSRTDRYTPMCPACSSDDIDEYSGRYKYECNTCGYVFN